MIRELTEDDVEFEVECLPEHEHPRGLFCSGDEEWDRQTVAQILQDMEWNEWAWCVAKVTAKWGEFEASEYLGCCSYESKKDFMSPGGYYDDMKHEALRELNIKIRSNYERLKSLEVLRVQDS